MLIPGIPDISSGNGPDIQPMISWVEVCGSPHSWSQPAIWPCWFCWVSRMSRAIWRSSGSSLRSRTSTDISTA